MQDALEEKDIGSYVAMVPEDIVYLGQKEWEEYQATKATL